MSYVEMLTWMNEKADEVDFMRDNFGRVTRVEVSFCYESTGCPGKVVGTDITEAVVKAAKEQKN